MLMCVSRPFPTRVLKRKPVHLIIVITCRYTLEINSDATTETDKELDITQVRIATPSFLELNSIYNDRIHNREVKQLWLVIKSQVQLARHNQHNRQMSNSPKWILRECH